LALLRVVYEYAGRAAERLAAGERFALAEVPSPAVVSITCKMTPDAAAGCFGIVQLPK